MKITKVYHKQQKRYCWKIEGQIDGVHISHSGYDAKKEAEEAVAALITQCAIARKNNQPSPMRRFKRGTPENLEMKRRSREVAERFIEEESRRLGGRK
ncbi:MAG: hypothetical protein J2P41_11015 [Blastocatellia bacterium]|nr:hypothetical protein [Blastocatellia bacterium]